MKFIYICIIFILFLGSLSCKKEIPLDVKNNGNLKYPGGSKNDKCFTVKPTSDGGFIYCGISYADSLNAQGYLMKVDATGKKEWYKTYGGQYFEEFHDVTPCSDGGFVAVGSKTFFFPGGNNLMEWVVKVNSNGEIVWNRSYSEGELALCNLVRVTETPDHEIVAVGYYPDPNVYMGVYYLRFKLDGTLIVKKEIQATSNHQPNLLKNIIWSGGGSIAINSAGDVLIGTILNGDIQMAGLLSINKSHDVNFYYPYENVSFGSSYYGRIGYNIENYPKVIQMNDGNYIIFQRDSIAQNKTYNIIQILKTDFNGKILWSKSQMGLGYSILNDVYLIDNFLYIVGASSSDQPNNNFVEVLKSSKGMILKLDKDANLIKEFYYGGDENLVNFKSFQFNPDKSLKIAGYNLLNNQGFHQMIFLHINHQF